MEKNRGFAFYENFWTSIEQLPIEQQKDICYALVKYGITGEMVDATDNALGFAMTQAFKPAIDNFLCPSTSEFEGEGLQKASALSDQLCRDLVENGIVMLKNEEIEPTVKSLPLSKDLTKVNVFGWSATNAGFAQKGIGSGSSAIDSKKSVSFLKGLTDFGVEYNTDIIKAYESFNKSGRTYAMHNSEVYRLKEPTVDFYSKQSHCVQ